MCDASSSPVLPEHWSRPQTPELKEDTISYLLPVGGQTVFDC